MESMKKDSESVLRKIGIDDKLKTVHVTKTNTNKSSDQLMEEYYSQLGMNAKIILSNRISKEH